MTATAAETESRAVSAMCSIIDAYPGHAAKIVRSTATFAVSPKVNNLYQAIEDAKYDLIATKDCNIVLPPQTARAAIAAMTEDVGLVTAITEARDAANPAAKIEASLMNQSHARILHAAAAIGLGFGLGKLMIFKRSDLHRAGGFDTIAHTVGEDSATAHALASIGLRTVIIGAPIYQMLGVRRFSDVYNRQMRWAVIRRQNELPGFLLEPLGLSVFVALAAAFAAPLFGWSGTGCGRHDAGVLVCLRNRACLGAGLGCIGERPRRHGRARRDDDVCLAARLVHQTRRVGGRSL